MSELKKILVVFTGGTIGSKKNDTSIDVDEATSYYLIQQYMNSPYAQDVHFETKHPLNLLSENIIPEDWNTLITSLNEINFEQFEGIILTHGSDTLPFTSACLSYAFRHSRIPIVLTASNYPLADPRSKGLRNFASSVDFILDQTIPGVFVSFENDKGESIIYLGTRLMEALPFTDEYDSTYAVPFGQMKNHRFVWTEHELNPTLAKLQSHREPRPWVKNIRFSTDILYIKPHPGLNYQFYDFTIHKPKAVLHDLYHSGTASTRDKDSFSLKPFIQYCKENNVKVYISPLKNAAGDLYTTSVELIEAGAVPIENTSVSASLVKLMLAYGLYETEQEISAFMNGEPLFFESH